MESISPSLLSKLKTNYQTIDNDANPHMEVILQKAAKYINQGTFLAPQTVRTGTSLGRLDVTIRRENRTEEPSEIVMVYIENGEAKVATLPYINTPDDLFAYQYTIGPASDVACDFDGRFEYISDYSSLYFDTTTVWALVTFGEPYFAVVNAGILTLYHFGEEPLVMASNVTRVSLLRGWKSISDIVNDQGLICAYIKTDGKVYYKNYCELPNGTFVWDLEHEVLELPSPNTELSLFRTADYRFGFIVENAGVLYWAITKRNWSGMANLPENITCILTASNSMLSIHSNIEELNTTITATIQADSTRLYANSPIMVSSSNIDDGVGNYGRFVEVLWDENIFGEMTNVAQFVIADSELGTWSCLSVVKIEKMLRLEFMDFNNAINPVSIMYTPGTMSGDVVAVESDSITFTAINLVPELHEPPVPIEISIIDAETITIKFDKPISSANWALLEAGFTVTSDEYNMIPEGTLESKAHSIDAIEYYAEYTVDTILMSSGVLTDVTLSYGAIQLMLNT